MTDVLIILTMFGTMFGIFYVYFTARNKERMAMIEKGIGADLFKTNKSTPDKKKYALLTSGLLLLSIGIGVFVAIVIADYYSIQEIASLLISLPIFSGLSLIGSYFIIRREEKTKREGETE